MLNNVNLPHFLYFYGVLVDKLPVSGVSLKRESGAIPELYPQL